mmetsp:Transcript_12843/g.9306  ORF Transcript_12843/g.9306 Transcript_12843/m.9306 type:complete len:87 (+) Transcript_12843:545-805(+)
MQFLIVWERVRLPVSEGRNVLQYVCLLTEEQFGKSDAFVGNRTDDNIRLFTCEKLENEMKNSWKFTYTDIFLTSAEVSVYVDVSPS